MRELRANPSAPLSEISPVRTHYIEKPCHHLGHTVEVPRPARSLSVHVQSTEIEDSLIIISSLGIHLFHSRSKQDRDPERSDKRRIVLQSSRIGLEIRLIVELSRVDKV